MQKKKNLINAEKYTSDCLQLIKLLSTLIFFEKNVCTLIFWTNFEGDFKNMPKCKLKYKKKT